MKKLLSLLTLSLCSLRRALCIALLSALSSAYAQTIPPPYINYQAVLYDVNGPNPNSPLTNQSFSTFVNINDELGNLLYREEHYASTDANGLITVKMGDGLYTAGPITNFNQIDWGVGKYYLVVDFDINGTISSTAPEQLVTVPYSFYAGKAGNGMTAVADNGNGTLTFTYANGSTYTTPTLAGIQGPVGPSGASGPSGPQGVAGQSAYDLWLAQGNTGTVQDFLSTSAYQIWLAQGNTGTAQDFLNTLVGPSGPQGIQGIQGIPGINGTNGATGPQGPQGIAGVNGVNGTDGSSAYEIAVLNGFVGTETQWLLSLVGATGPAGAIGAQGPQGIQGPVGNDGATGQQGPIGLQGTQGQPGVDGANGLNALIKATTEVASANCANGGTKIETGLDANGNGILEAGEVNATQTKYVCNGATGAQGTSAGTQTLTINGVNTTQYIPDYLFDTGNCANGSLSTTGNYTLNSTFAQYCNLKINAGHTFNLGANDPSDERKTYTILVKDTLTINGTISGRNTGFGMYGMYGQSTSINNFLMTAGGSGGAAPRNVAFCMNQTQDGKIEWNSLGNSLNINPPSFTYTLPSGGDNICCCGISSSGCGTVAQRNGNSSSTANLKEGVKIRSDLFGIDGCASVTWNTSSASYQTNGGASGDGLYLICRVLVINSTASIDMRGNNGGAYVFAGYPTVYGGGGGGGSLVISAETIVSNQGSIVQTGGLGGNSTSPTYCNSGNGGNGAFLIIDR